MMRIISYKFFLPNLLLLLTDESSKDIKFQLHK